MGLRVLSSRVQKLPSIDESISEAISRVGTDRAWSLAILCSNRDA